MSGAPLVVDDLTHVYRSPTSDGRRRKGTRPALAGVSFAVGAGESLGIIGHNGSGKTTLLQCIAGVVLPTSGRIDVSGRVVSLVHLYAGLNRELTGRENLMVAGVLNGLTRREVRDRADEMLAFAGLSDVALDTPLRTYSSGMGLRLGFSVAVHSDPSVLVVDEVLAVGDASFQGKCHDRIRALRDGGCAVVIVSHQLDLIARECDRVGILDQGHLTFLGSASDALTRYKAPPPVEAGAIEHGARRKATARRRRARRAP